LLTPIVLVGPWQTPVADVAVTMTSFSLDEKSRTGECFAMGEKPTIALISPAASARMAVVESLMNLGAADIKGSKHRRGDLRRGQYLPPSRLPPVLAYSGSNLLSRYLL
jgi:phosphoribosylformylglycinamidine synthase